MGHDAAVMDEDRPTTEPTPRGLLKLALGLDIPFYLILGWLIQTARGNEPMLADELRFPLFAAFAVAGLTMAMFSLPLRTRLARRPETRPPWSSETRALLWALMTAEIPAFLGLVYFILYREWSGFCLLLGTTLAAFWAHRTRLGT